MLLSLPILLAASVLTSALAIPSLEVSSNLQADNEVELSLNKRGLDSSTNLRIMPLGASITAGYLSSKGYGYRKPLQDLLVAQGVNVDFVGSRVVGGPMPNNHVEAKSGETISQVTNRFAYSQAQRPNVVLIHAGTNDLGDDKPPAQWAAAPGLVGKLIDKVHAACPDAVILVAKLVHQTKVGHAAQLKRTIDFNNAVSAIIWNRAASGVKIANPDMTTVNDLSSDGTHPNDDGYRHMATIWMASLQAAQAKGWISAPLSQYPDARE